MLDLLTIKPEDQTFRVDIQFMENGSCIGEGYEVLYQTAHGQNLTRAREVIYKPSNDT